MNFNISLQAICKIKEIRTSNLAFSETQEANISEINTLLSKGWILLRIYSTVTIDSSQEDMQSTAEIMNYVLGFPHNGVSYIADKFRGEFDQ